MFKICNKGALKSLSSQAKYNKFGSVLNSPPHGAKCMTLIMKACTKDVMGPRITVRSGIFLGRVELLVKRLGSTNTTTKTKTTTSHHMDKTIIKPHKNLEEGIKLAYYIGMMPTTLLTTSLLLFSLSFLFFFFFLIFFLFCRQAKMECM